MSSGFPAFLPRGKIWQAKNMRRSLKFSKILVKIFFSYASLSNLSKAGQLFRPFCTPHFLMRSSQGCVFPLPQHPNTKPYGAA